MPMLWTSRAGLENKVLLKSIKRGFGSWSEALLHEYLAPCRYYDSCIIHLRSFCFYYKYSGLSQQLNSN